MTPEEKARQAIDQMLNDAGWQIVPRSDFTLDSSAVAVTEGLLNGNLEADYLLFLEGKAIGVLEAKREDVDLLSVAAEQAENYTHNLPLWCASWHEDRHLPLVYLSNGKELFFKNLQDNSMNDYMPLNEMHSPKDIVKLTGISSYFAGLPTLKRKGVRDCQYDAITNLEKTFRDGQKKALIVLATGAGKTYTACLAAYRLLTYTPAKRILFLVDRNNLGKQAEGEFGSFRLTYNGEPFNTIYETERLKSKEIAKSTSVVISTIQRLFAYLTGQDMMDDDDSEDENADGDEVDLPSEDLKLSPDFFDVIIVDECHRSIYGRWKKVLDYFTSARLIGLTATPDPSTTLPFFNNNRVVNYTLEKSIADGINVDARIYRIKTKVTEEGGVINKGTSYAEKSKYTGKEDLITAKESSEYKSTELDRSVVNLEQIRLVMQSYKDAIYKDLYPDREQNYNYIPKTLIFAKSDAHATNIVKILREQIFPEQGEKFVQKITYSAGDTNALIREFRNDKDFRIAVTVTLVATGTDVKPLEVLVFMRDVKSEALYVQMKGRGVRTVQDDVLRNVTPNATSKDCFYLIDAVGVTEHEKSIPPIDGGENRVNIPLKDLLERVSHGYLPDDYLRLLASRLSRINQKANDEQRSHFETLAGCSMKSIALEIFSAMNPETSTLPVFKNVNELNLERKRLVAPLANNPKARDYLLYINAGFLKTLSPGEDTLLYIGFSKEEAQSTTAAFEKYIDAHKDEIEALRIIYNNTGEPITHALLEDLAQKLSEANRKFNIPTLWNSYFVLNSETKRLNADERKALTTLIQLVRFAFKKTGELMSLLGLASRNYTLWAGQAQRPLTPTQQKITREIAKYIAADGAMEMRDLMQINTNLFAQSVKAFEGKDNVKDMLYSLSSFMFKAA